MASAALAALVWAEVLWRAAPRDAGALPPVAAAAVGLATQLVFTAIEATFGVAAWSLLGRACRWASLLPGLLTASVAEAMAVSVASGTPSLGLAWRVALAGARAWPAPPSDPLARAFASVGVLTLLRLGFAARSHVEASQDATPGSIGCAPRVSGREAVALVLAFHLATRLAMWWSLSLLQGHSFEGGGM